MTYDLEIGNASEPIGEGIFVVGFKTTEPNVALAQLIGKDGRHLSLGLEKGYLRLYYNLKKKKTSGIRTGIKYRHNEVIGITKGPLNDGRHHVARVMVSTEEVFLRVPDVNLEVGANASESFIDLTNKNKGKYVDHFDVPIKFAVGTWTDMDGSFLPFAQTYSGCMSGAKLIYNPRATTTKRYRKSFEVDMFKLVSDRGKEGTGAGGKIVNPTGTFPSDLDRCGPYYKVPGMFFYIYFTSE